MKDNETERPISSRNKRLQVLVIDDHPLTRIGIRELLRTTPDLEVCGEIGKASEALPLLDKLKPDLVVLDLSLPDRNGIEVLKEFQSAAPTLPVLVVSMYDEMLYAERTLRGGARGYIMKDAGGEKLLQAIRAALEGRVWVSEQVSSELLGNLGRRSSPGRELLLDRLSYREFEIFRMLGEGANTRDIAERLNLSPKTVDAHRANIKTKLGLKDGAALVRQSVRWNEAQSAKSGALASE